MPSKPDNSQFEIDCQSVKAKLDRREDFLLLDCREQEEFDVVKIAQARLIPMSELPERIAELESYRQRPIVVHCHHGGRSLKVTHWLLQSGFANVKSMAGGIDQWATDIDPALARY
jgi:rhodanese-related sulfurtransferase